MFAGEPEGLGTRLTSTQGQHTCVTGCLTDLLHVPKPKYVAQAASNHAKHQFCCYCHFRSSTGESQVYRTGLLHCVK